MRLLLIRHGQTDANAERRAMGTALNQPLNTTGKDQVRAQLPQLPGDIDLLFSSPLRRAVDTAEIVAADRGLEILLRAELSEQDVGDLTGYTWDEMDGVAARLRGRDNWPEDEEIDFGVFGGESRDRMERRVCSFVDELRAHYANRLPLLVTHGGVIRIILRAYGGEALTATPNASLHQLIV